MNAREILEMLICDGDAIDTVATALDTAGFTIMSKEDVEAVRDKAQEEAAKAVEQTYGISAAAIRSLKSIPHKE